MPNPACDVPEDPCLGLEKGSAIGIINYGRSLSQKVLPPEGSNPKRCAKSKALSWAPQAQVPSSRIDESSLVGGNVAPPTVVFVQIMSRIRFLYIRKEPTCEKNRLAPDHSMVAAGGRPQKFKKGMGSNSDCFRTTIQSKSKRLCSRRLPGDLHQCSDSPGSARRRA